MSGPSLPILCVDFDGVIHDYRHGWQGGRLYGDVTPGFFQWLQKTRQHFRVVIYSSRSSDPKMVEDMKVWLARQNGGVMPSGLEFAREKPPAFLTIDDRCVRFTGSWDDLDPQSLRNFVPWMIGERQE
jgi:hypothetical protein